MKYCKQENKKVNKTCLNMSWLHVFFGFSVIFVNLMMSTGQNYCSICRDHTLCKPHYPKPACTTKSYGITPELKNLLLNEHNRYRRLVASGGEKRGNPGPQPAAKFMPDLTWDDEIANIAQTLANSCKYGHDSCRNVQRYQVGQNIAQGGILDNNVGARMKSLVALWYNEVKLFNPRKIDNFQFEKPTGHYTQMLWAKTTKLGCGYVNYKNGNGYTVYLVCDYGPTGNFPGQKMYERR